MPIVIEGMPKIEPKKELEIPEEKTPEEVVEEKEPELPTEESEKLIKDKKEKE